MNTKIFASSAAAVLIFWAGLAFAAPLAVPIHSTYEFPPTPEGETIVHEFIIRNQGDTDLSILKVIPSCSCVSHSYDRTIAPGKEGIIKIGLKTGGSGGSLLTRKILVKTSDPDNRQLYLTITGKVTPTITVTPSAVSLRGRPGEHLERVVTISPATDAHIKILEMAQRFNTRIGAILQAPGRDDRDWHVNITTFSDKPDDFYDIITLKTDNPAKPALKIRVYVTYTDQAKGSSS